MNLQNKNVLVFGTGISGIAAAGLLEDKGAHPVLFDGNAELEEKAIRAKLPEESKAEILLGDLTDEQIRSLDLVVLSPGVPTDLPLVNRLRESGLKIWGEIELAYECSRGDVLAITGTNGKTTTTSLLGAIMQHAKESAFIVGNIGIPYTQIVEETK